MPRKIATFIMNHRFLVLGAFVFITLFFAYQIKDMEVKANLSDMLPAKHPYIVTHKQYEEQLGDPLKVFLMLRVSEGTIYTPETLEKIRRITERIDAIPGVNHDQVYSIASRKVKKVVVSGDTIFVDDLMKDIPHTNEGVLDLRETVRRTPGVFGVYVSLDEKSALFTGAFFSESIDFDILFRQVREIVHAETDENHALYAAGEPILTGWVYYYQQEVYRIFAITIAVLFLLLYLYFRNLVGVLVPALSTLVGAIWGLGFCGMLGYNLEPLTLVIPLLIAARALSHSVQVTERYFECYEEYKDVRTACIECASSILPPGILGITTDGLGILLIAVAPIPMMQKLAYICSFWAFMIVFTGLIFTPVIISFFKPSKNIPDIVDMSKGLTQKVLGKIAGLGYGRAGVGMVIGAAVLFAVCGWIASKVDIGDVHPGSPILWQDSDYNLAVGQVNRYFPGTDELYVIVEGEGKLAVEDPAFLKILDSFQRHMEKRGFAAATLSVADLLRPIVKATYAGHPKFEVLPDVREESSQLFYFLLATSAPGDFDRYFSRTEEVANVIVWYKDHTGDTLRNAISSAKEFIEDRKTAIAEANVRFRLASGSIGVLAARNETVKDSQLLNFVLVMSVIFILCSITYRSIVAAVILMIPLNLTNLIVLSIMKGMGVGLNINTLPIISVGVGVGIDYGIYLLSRLCEESQSAGEYSLTTANKAIRTTGKAIFFTATTMIGGVIFWYFLSSMRFQAEMGLLLAIIMFINMVGALILIPALVYVVRPRFLRKTKLLISENERPSLVV